MEEFITLSEAARRAGYRSLSTIRKAAQDGRLRTVRVSDRVQLTKPSWLEKFLATQRQSDKYHRGKERKPRRPASEETP